MMVNLRKLTMILVDLVLINLAFFIAFMIRFDWRLTPALTQVYFGFLLWLNIIRIMVFIFSGLYQ